VTTRLRVILSRLQAEEDPAAFEEYARALEANIDALGVHIQRAVAALAQRNRLAVASVVTGLAVTLLSATIPALGAVGAGYFLRFGILLIGIGLHFMLRR
jgi:hypothetical protein